MSRMYVDGGDGGVWIKLRAFVDAEGSFDLWKTTKKMMKQCYFEMNWEIDVTSPQFMIKLR